MLTQFATTLQRLARLKDAAVRLGGDEFVMILPNVTVEMARLVAEGVRADFTAGAAHFDRGELCTVSAGVAVAGEGGQSLDDVLHLADEALYLAKRSGRDRVALTALKLAS